ncbi:MAG: PIN domain-containing protein [Micromonosporaceae bacterium]|nr:PIN domain-containing protein [Micromonosporaceae bacterium]
MILVDVNLLIYAKIEESAQHEVARAWLDDRLAQPRRVGLPWESLMGFARITTNPRIMRRPLSSEQAWSQIEDWLDRDSAWIPLAGPRHREVLADLVAKTEPTANLVPDAHLAALALQHGLTLATTDRGFAVFPGLRWENPLD